jgi:hypothetical protein
MPKSSCFIETAGNPDEIDGAINGAGSTKWMPHAAIKNNETNPV